MRLLKSLRKILTVIATIALLFNSLAPYSVALAQELTPTPTPTDSATSTSQPTTTPSDTPVATPTITATPTDTATATPVDLATPTATDTATPTDQPTITPTDTPSAQPTDNSQQTTNNNPQPDSSTNQPTSQPSATPAVTITPTPTPQAPIEHGTLTETVITGIDLSGVTPLNSNVAGTSTVSTNQADYSPTSLVLITGSGFTPNKTYTINIVSTNQPPVNFTDQVKADSTGKISYSYQLDGTYRPNYTAYIKDGAVVVATTAFTDSVTPGVDVYSQCANGSGSGPTCNWTNGDLNNSNSRYFEGDATPQRLAIQDLVTGDYTATIQYDTTQGGKHSYDFITDDLFSEGWITASDLCSSPISHFADCNTSTAVQSNLIPTDTNAAGHDTATGSRHFTIRNGTWISGGILSGPTLVSGSYAGNSSTNIQLKFHVDTTTCSNKYTKSGTEVCEVLITFGAHVAKEADWGTGNAAANINGSSYHVRIVELNGGSIGNRDNQMSANAVVFTTPTVTTTIHNTNHQVVTSVPAGSTVHDSVTVSGSGNNPPTATGTVVFKFFNNGGCSNSPAATSSPFTLSSGSVDGTTFTQGPLAGGSYSFNAHYNGDSNYLPTDSACEPLTVTGVTPTISTTPNPSSGSLGATLNDSAALSGGVNTPTGSILFSLYSPSDATCSNTAAFTNSVSVSGNGTYNTSSGFLSNATGTWHWKAAYSGDGSNNAVTSACADEPVTVNKLGSTIVTEIHNASHAVVTSVDAGTTVHDKATVTGSGPTPTGNVNFTFYSGANNCTGDSVAAGTVALDGSGIAHPSSSEGPLNAGLYSFKAHYNGDGNYNSSDSACEPLTVNKIDPSVVTTIHNAGHQTVTSVSAGSTVHDSATVSGSFGTPTGNVDFTFYNNEACTPDGTSAGNVALVSGVADPSNNEGPLNAGSYSFKAHYNGNGNYNTKDSGCEPLTVNPVTPSISTTPSATPSAILGATLTDSATLSNGVNTPTGSILFSLYGPGDNTCQTSLFTNSVSVNGNGTYNTSAGFTAFAAGIWNWIAAYSGDANNNSVSGKCGDESITINKADTRVSTHVHDPSHNDITNSSVALGTAVHDNAEVSGKVGNTTITGTVTYNLYSNANCDSALVIPAETVAVGSESTPQTLGAGTYGYKASYSGDSNYKGSTGSCEPFTINKAQLGVETTVHSDNPDQVLSGDLSLGSGAHDSANVTGKVGSFTLPDVTFYFFAKGVSCTNGDITGATQLNTISPISGIAHPSTSETNLGAGTYNFMAVVAGNSNYTGVTSGCEPFTVDKSQLGIITAVHSTSHNDITNGSVDAGSIVHDTATVSGAIDGFEFPTPTFTLTSNFTDSCANGTAVGNDGIDPGNGGFKSSNSSALDAGHYAYMATVAENDNYIGAGSTCEPFTVNTLTPGFSTTPSASPSPVLGATISDSATLTGGFNLTGSILFQLYSPLDPTCQKASQTSQATVNGAGTYNSTGFPAFMAGLWNWIAAYSGDKNNNPVSGKCGDEPININRANTEVATQVHDPSHKDITGGSVALGTAIHDKAIISEQIGDTPITGTVTYNLYGNGSCTGDVIIDPETVTVGIESTHQILGAGTYGYVASYSGDKNYNGSTGKCEPFTINRAQLGITTAVHDASHNDITNGSVDAGSTVHDTATVTGQVEGFEAPTPTFTLTSNFTESCNEGAPVGNDGFDSANKGYKSSNISNLSAGNYAFQASVEENNNYIGSSSDCEPFNIISKAIKIEKSNDSPNTSAGSTVTYKLVITNTGSVTLNKVSAQDVLPAGFNYVTGSTSGATTNDPTISGSSLTWDLTSAGPLAPNNNFTLFYKVTLAGNLTNGTYTNFASCSSVYGITIEGTFRQIGDPIDCNTATSTVTIGNGVSFGGNIPGQVLGISTELPATGSPTGIIAFAILAIGAGLLISGYNRRKKKYAKN